MAESPTSKQQALMQFAVEEATQVIDRAENVNEASQKLIDMFLDVHTMINDDLTRLGNMVQTVAQSKDAYRQEAEAFTSHIDEKFDQIKLAIQSARVLQAKKTSILMPVVLSVVLTASMAFAGAYLYYAKNIQQKEAIGEKIIQNWKNLDNKTKSKINSYLAK